MTAHSSPFQPNLVPKNGLTLLWWVIFEPVILRSFGKTLTKKETREWFLKAYIWSIPFIIGIVLIVRDCIIWIIIQTDLPVYYLTEFEPKVIAFWQEPHHFSTKFQFLFFYDLALGLALGLTVGLAVGLVESQRKGLAFGLALGLALGLAFGFALGLAGGLVLGLAFGLASGSAFGSALGLAGGSAFSLELSLAGGFTLGLVLGLVGGFTLGLVLGLVGGLVGLAGGLAEGLGFTFCFYLFYFRIPFYPFHWLTSLFRSSLTRNPYLSDGVIWLPIWGLTTRLTQQAQQQPELASKFVEFLLLYRPLQRNLALHLSHAVQTGLWQQHLLSAEVLTPPLTIKRTKKSLQPSESWETALKTLQTQLMDYEQQNNLGQKNLFFNQFAEQLQRFYELTLRESPHWNHYYIPAIKQWLTATQDKQQELAEQMRQLEPIEKNHFRAG